MTDLVLPLKAEYFDAIKAGTKPEEFRLANDYWRKRLEGRTFDRIVLTKGYPKRGDTERRIVKPCPQPCNPAIGGECESAIS